MMNQRVRDVRVDILKGLGIILMVMGHSGFPFTDFIYLFHMAIFVMASGFCWNVGKPMCKEDFWNYIVKKVRTLYCPYVAFNAIFTLLNNVLIDLNIYTDNPAFTGTIKTKYGGLSIVNAIIALLHFDPSVNTGLCGAAWFVIVLFYVEVGGAMLLFLTRKFSCYFQYVLLCGSAVAALAASYYMQKYNVWLVYYATPAFVCFFLYVLGVYLKIFYDIFVKRREAMLKKYGP